MKLEVDEEGEIVLKEVFSGVMLETGEGNRVGICMRDDSFEFNVLPANGDNQWYRIDMATMKVIKS